jgi:hypothetical protein
VPVRVPERPQLEAVDWWPKQKCSIFLVLPDSRFEISDYRTRVRVSAPVRCLLCPSGPAPLMGQKDLQMARPSHLSSTCSSTPALPTGDTSRLWNRGCIALDCTVRAVVNQSIRLPSVSNQQPEFAAPRPNTPASRHWHMVAIGRWHTRLKLATKTARWPDVTGWPEWVTSPPKRRAVPAA